jgi:hypothetical protein
VKNFKLVPKLCFGAANGSSASNQDAEEKQGFSHNDTKEGHRIKQAIKYTCYMKTPLILGGFFDHLFTCGLEFVAFIPLHHFILV